MPGLVNRIDEITIGHPAEYKRDLDNFNNSGDPCIIHTERYLAAVNYVRRKDSDEFRNAMYKTANYLVGVFERHEKNMSVSFSYIDDDSHERQWNALASGDWNISKRLMEYIYKYNQDDKDSYPPEWQANTNLKKSTPFDRYFNYMFQMVILRVKRNKNVFKEAREVFLKKHKSYAGYPLCFEAIYNQNKEAFEVGIKEVMKGHRVLCRRGAKFGDTEDEIIAIWPLGLINLARMKGMDVSAEDELVPKDLLAEVGIAK